MLTVLLAADSGLSPSESLADWPWGIMDMHHGYGVQHASPGGEGGKQHWGWGLSFGGMDSWQW